MASMAKPACANASAIAIMEVRLLVTPCCNSTTGQPSSGARPMLGSEASTGMRSRPPRGRGIGVGRRGGRQFRIHPDAAQNVARIAEVPCLHPSHVEACRPGESQAKLGGGNAHGRKSVRHGGGGGLDRVENVGDGLRGGAPGDGYCVAGNSQQPLGRVDQRRDGGKQRIQFRRTGDAVKPGQVGIPHGGRRPDRPRRPRRTYC